MDFIQTGLLISSALCIALIVLFSFEAKQTDRIGEPIRARADFLVLRMVYAIRQMIRHVQKDMFRQIAHYIFHRVLNRILRCITWSEERLRKVMHVNKKLAKSAERESVTKTQLEELTLHKVATSLTEEQKKKRKEKSLRGL